MKRGFTLIELLVVIAIIGILSSVVLASLDTARAKGADAAIKENLANIRAQAEIMYDSNGNYDGLCTQANASAQIASAASAAGLGVITPANNEATAGAAAQWTCHEPASPAATWAVDMPLKTASANSWCVDSTGKSEQVTAGYIAANINACP